MKSTGYTPLHTTHKTSALKVKASVLATLLALPLSAYSFNVPQIKVPELPSLNSPDFEDNSGFIENTLPVQSYRYQALDAEGLQKQIDSSSSNYLLKYTSLGSNWESKRLINIDGENNSVNAGQKDLRFYQTIEDESLRVTRKSNLSLNTEGDIQFYGEDLLRLIYSDSNSTLSIQSNNIWLNHKITDVNSNYGSLIYGNTNSNTSFTTANDFVAIIDASEIQTFKNIDYSIIRGSSLSINSSNIYVIQNLHDSAQNSISTGIDLYGGNSSSESSLNASSNIFIQGVNTGIYSEIALNVSAKDFVINTNSYKDLHGTGSSSNNTGIHAKNTLTINTDNLFVSGAYDAIKLEGDHKHITANTVIFLDAGGAKDIDESIELDSTLLERSIGLQTDLSYDVLISAPSIIINNFSTGILAEDDSDLDVESKDIFITNDTKSSGTHAIAISRSYGNLTSETLNISGYQTAIGIYDLLPSVTSSFSQRSGYNLNKIKSINIENVNVGFKVDNSDLTVNTVQALIQTSDNGQAFSLSDKATLNFTSTQNSNIVGDIAVDNSTFTLAMGAESELVGKAVNVGENSTLDITMGEKSLWTVTDASNLSTLKTSDSTIVLDRVGDGTAPSLSMDALTGTGNTFVLAHDETLTSVSFISMKESDAETTHTVQLGDSAIAADLGEVNVQFATDESGQTIFEAGSSITEAGLFITSPELDAQTNAAGGKDWFITNVENTPAPTPESIVSSLGNNYFFWRGLTESTRERFGQLRHGENAGVWGRITAGALSYGGIEANYQTYRLGADTSINPNWKVGVMLEQHEGKLDASEGRGDMDATTASLYALYTGNNGVYADGGLRFGIMDYEYVNRSMLVDAYDYDSSAVGGWLEVGHEWVFAGGWTVSPHVAFSYGRFAAEDFTTDNGLKVKADSVDSGIFTLGTDFGFKLDRLEVLFTADTMHEALGDQTITVSHEDSRIRQDVNYSDTWAEFGFNLSYRPTDQSLVWLNVRRSALADVEQDWKINLGARLLFN